MNPMWSYVLTAGGVLGLYLAGRKNWMGWGIGLSMQAFWVAYAINTQQWGFIVSAFAYGSVYAINLRKWHREDWDKAQQLTTPQDVTIDIRVDTDAHQLRNIQDAINESIRQRQALENPNHLPPFHWTQLATTHCPICGTPLMSVRLHYKPAHLDLDHYDDLIAAKLPRPGWIEPDPCGCELSLKYFTLHINTETELATIYRNSEGMPQ